MAATEPGDAPTSYSSTRPWRDQVWECLDLLFRVMGYTSPEAGEMALEERVAYLIENWATSGIPDDLTPEAAMEAVEVLTDLEILLSTQPPDFPALLRMEALATVASMRDALLGSMVAEPVAGGVQ